MDPVRRSVHAEELIRTTEGLLLAAPMPSRRRSSVRRMQGDVCKGVERDYDCRHSASNILSDDLPGKRSAAPRRILYCLPATHDKPMLALAAVEMLFIETGNTPQHGNVSKGGNLFSRNG